MTQGILSEFEDTSGVFGTEVEISKEEEDRIVKLPSDIRFRFTVKMVSSQNKSANGQEFYTKNKYHNLLIDTGLEILEIEVINCKTFYKKGETIECEGIKN